MNMENKNLLPVITSENDVYPYLKKINQFMIIIIFIMDLRDLLLFFLILKMR